MIGGETRERRLTESIAVIQGQRDKELTPAKKSKQESNMSWIGYSGGEARRIIMTPYLSLMARNVLAAT